jgi:hypothetical protein
MAKKFTRKEDSYIKANFNDVPSTQIAAKLGLFPGSVRQRMKFLGVKPSPEKLEEFKRMYTFKKGCVSWNKGKKIVSTEAMKATQFKKGDIPANTLPEHTIAARMDKSGRIYLWLRLGRRNWKHVHVCLWEHYHGKVPAAHCVVFLNKDTFDVRIENLELITMQENMKRNMIHNYPEPIKKAIRTLSKLKRTIKTKTETHGQK